jgi:predicted patatin/cPLA2 family phospholipase
VHEVLRVIEERARSGSRPGHRDDGLRIALSIEGGGMRGTVSAGMALALYERGLLPAFDAVYGSSAGAISGAWLVSSDPEGLRGWADPDYARSLIRWSAPLHRRPRRRPVVDVETLIEVLYQTEFPMDFASILASPIEYHPLATDAATGESTDLRPLITDAAELRLALRASASLPFLAGPPIELHDRRFYDAGVAESIPFRTPLAQGATHILVLRSRRPLAAGAGPAGADDEAEIIDGAEIIEETEADLEAEADTEAEAEDQAEAEVRAEADRPAQAAGAPSAPGSPAARPARPPRSVRLLNRTTLRRESPEFRTALLTRAGRNLADAKDMADRQAAGHAFTVFPPAWTPQVSRLTTDGALLTAALVSGREAVNVLFDEPDETDQQHR